MFLFFKNINRLSSCWKSFISPERKKPEKVKASGFTCCLSQCACRQSLITSSGRPSLSCCSSWFPALLLQLGPAVSSGEDWRTVTTHKLKLAVVPACPSHGLLCSTHWFGQLCTGLFVCLSSSRPADLSLKYGSVIQRSVLKYVKIFSFSGDILGFTWDLSACHIQNPSSKGGKPLQFPLKTDVSGPFLLFSVSQNSELITSLKLNNPLFSLFYLLQQ